MLLCSCFNLGSDPYKTPDRQKHHKEQYTLNSCPDRLIPDRVQKHLFQSNTTDTDESVMFPSQLITTTSGRRDFSTFINDRPRYLFVRRIGMKSYIRTSIQLNIINMSYEYSSILRIVSERLRLFQKHYRVLHRDTLIVGYLLLLGKEVSKTIKFVSLTVAPYTQEDDCKLRVKVGETGSLGKRLW